MGIKGAIRFTLQDDEILIENWWDSKRREEIAKQIGHPVDSCNFRYYKILREQNIDPEFHSAQKKLECGPSEGVRNTGSSNKTTSKKNRNRTSKKINVDSVQQHNGLTEVISSEDIYARMDKLEESIKGNREGEQKFMDWLQSALYLYKSGTAVNNIEKIIRENTRLNARIEQLEEKLSVATEEYSKSIMAVEREKSDLDFILESFYRLQSGQKYAELGEFLPKLKLSIDKFGVVISNAKDKEKLGTY